MPIRVHYDKLQKFAPPHIAVQYDGAEKPLDLAPSGTDSYGPYYDLPHHAPAFFHFRFQDAKDGKAEADNLIRAYSRDKQPETVWCQGYNAFVYAVEPRPAEAQHAADFLKTLPFKPGMYIPETGGLSGLGAHMLADGRVLFGLFHPHAARVYLAGEFNGWSRPHAPTANHHHFIEMKRYRGYFDMPNLWLAVVEGAKPGQHYQFYVQGGVPGGEGVVMDIYARRAGQNLSENHAVIIDPTTYEWGDSDWKTTPVDQLILYELSIYGFTHERADIPPEHQGKFMGVIDRIEEGYFERLGVTALSIMPINEFSNPQGPEALGYNPSLYFALEQDFGEPDAFRGLVDAAHGRGLAVIMDQVFNHTDNGYNPLWKLILEHPAEEADGGEGGLYFSGGTPWGNRVSTERPETQNLLIDACKLMLKEYHVDGFRFDFTHSSLMDHGFLNRLAAELQAFKPDVILIAENMPNERDLNREGFNGFAQWNNEFHDKLKALLREGIFEGERPDFNELADIFYFSKSLFAAHTNNVVNYVESHDEHSVSHEVASNPALDNPASKERKGRLGLFASLVALGQPMIYSGQEFNVQRPRNTLFFDWPADLDTHGFFQWAARLMRLRKRYPGLRLCGFDPAKDGQLAWACGYWMDPAQGGGSRVVGWQAIPNDRADDRLVVLLNFENHPVEVDVNFGAAGTWVRLANIDFVNDIAPEGTNSKDDETALRTADGRFASFVLPDSSGFIYKWEAPYEG
jgi:1,4-alpha-glucan branching enzyme